MANGLISPFMGEKLRGEADYRFIAVEPASCPSLTHGVFAYDYCDTGMVFTLRGGKVLELFGQIAAVGGEGVSNGVELVITKDGRLKSAKLHGKAIDPKAEYRVATLDYVAQGNDNMTAFKASTAVNSPRGEGNNVRFIIMDYMKKKMSQGISISARVEGRIKIDGK